MEEIETIPIGIYQERCQRICEGLNCFANNKKQFMCICDMLINKAWPIKDLIAAAMKENKCSEVAEILKMASDNVDELVNWVKQLQAKRREKEVMPESNIIGFVVGR